MTDNLPANITLPREQFESLLSFVSATLAVKDHCEYLLATTPPMPDDPDHAKQMAWMTLGAKAVAEAVQTIMREAIEAVVTGEVSA